MFLHFSFVRVRQMRYVKTSEANMLAEFVTVKWGQAKCFPLFQSSC